MVVILPLFLTRLFASVRLIIYRMVKRVRRIVSGQCAIARICGETGTANGSGGAGSTDDSNTSLTDHTRDMTAQLWEEWSKSSKLKPSFDSYARQADMSVNDAVESICTVKKLDLSAPCVTNLRLCIDDIAGVNKLRQLLNERVSIQFDSKNETHEAKLEQLWQMLLPGVERSGGRFSKDWNRIGFQQADPASDFRGGGILALDQLLHLATTRTSVAQRMLNEPASDMSRYPWACVGINLTREVLRVLDQHLIDKRLYGLDESQGIDLVNDLYSDMFEVLHHHWVQENPENVLAFPHVLKRVMADVDKQLMATGVIVPPGTSAA